MWLLQFFNGKVRAMVRGRQQQRAQLTAWHKEHVEGDSEVIMIHCSSLGEFEQGRVLISALREKYPTAQLVLTFFSPSGYNACKSFEGVDAVFYLPFDTRRAVRTFLRAVSPSKVFIIKYEYWYNLLRELKSSGSELYLVSAIFRSRSAFFSSYAPVRNFYRSMLSFFTTLFVQDSASAELLSQMGYTHNVMVAGDTRFDRVYELSSQAKANAFVEQFVSETSSPVVVCGSTWAADEELLLRVMHLRPQWRFVVAPHEIHEAQIKRFIEQSGRSSARYSSSVVSSHDTLLVVDTIGVLRSLYRYATVCYIGGGFGSGIHNTLEAAVWGKPVVFGPRYEKFREAHQLISCGGGFSVSDFEGLLSVLDAMVEDGSVASQCSKLYVETEVGATARIISAL